MRRLVVPLGAALLLAAAGMVVADRVGGGEVRQLRVTAPGSNAAIERTALDFLRARASAQATGATGLRRLYGTPRVVGLAQPRRNVVVAGVADEVVLDGERFTVYSVVTLLNRSAAGYQVDASGTACDGSGAGLVFAVPVPGDDVVVALDTSTSMRAWTDPELHAEQVETVRDEGDSARACPPG